MATVKTHYHNYTRDLGPGWGGARCIVCGVRIPARLMVYAIEHGALWYGRSEKQLRKPQALYLTQQDLLDVCSSDPAHPGK